MRTTLKGLILVSCLSMFSLSSRAQTAEDILRNAQVSRQGVTARVSAMGGAFTSLGADLSSIEINPAGIGMYRSSEVSITPSIYWSGTTSSVYDIYSSTFLDSYKERASMVDVSSYGGVLNLFKDNFSTVKALNFALSYNSSTISKTSSYNESPASGISIADYFAADLFGINSSYIDNSDSKDPQQVYLNASPDLWGAMMAYNNYLTEESVSVDGVPSYYIHSKTLAVGDMVYPSQLIKEKTIVNNISFSLGANIADYVYLGFTMGARQYSYDRYSEYDEYGDTSNYGDFDHLYYMQNNTVRGTAFNFKVGATVEPVSGLKLGVAYHVGTMTETTDEYYADQYMSYTNGDSYLQQTPYSVVSYNMKSAPSLLLGGSYRLPFGIVSFDYERTSYNKIKISGITGAGNINDDINDMFQAADNFMGGIEIRPASNVYLRGGYAFYGSAYKDNTDSYGTRSNISVGAGLRFSNCSFDVSYVNSCYKAMPSVYYYTTNGTYDDGTVVEIIPETYIENKVVQSMLNFTFAVRF